MKAWHFSENAYPYLPPADEYESIRVSLPSRFYDPKKGAALYDRYIDEWLVAEDEGAHPDEEADLVARDTGIDGGAATAEEAAMHIVDDDDTDIRSGG